MDNCYPNIETKLRRLVTLFSVEPICIFPVNTNREYILSDKIQNKKDIM